MLLVGFAVKQHLNYKNKKLQSLKRVTDTLFFKNLTSNRGVLLRVVDGADGEMGKEMLLAYYHLLEHGSKTEQQLGRLVEDRLRKTCGREVDFNVDRALQSPSSITAFGNGSLVSRVEGRWAAVTLTDAKKRLDKRWDNIFGYNSEQSAAV